MGMWDWSWLFGIRHCYNTAFYVVYCVYMYVRICVWVICRNMLYITPLSLDFRSGKGRNVGVKMQCMSGEDPNETCRNIYGKSCSPQYLSETWIPVLYHNRWVG